MKNTLHFLTVRTAALALNLSTGVGQALRAADAAENRASTASPSEKEVLPWLTRSPVTRTKARCEETKENTALAAVRRNRALADRPHMLEPFPELARSAELNQSAEFSIAHPPHRHTNIHSRPRMRDRSPALTRGPVTGPTKGGVPNLMEPGM